MNKFFVALALFIFSLSSSAYGHAKERHKDQRVLLAANVEKMLEEYRIPRWNYNVTRATNDHLFVKLRNGRPDSFRDAIARDPKAWKKDPRFLVLLYHHHWRRTKSYHSRTIPSVHITQVGVRAYSIDIDKHMPSVGHPVETFKHFIEILKHLTGGQTDQEEIKNLLAKRPGR